MILKNIVNVLAFSFPKLGRSNILFNFGLKGFCSIPESNAEIELDDICDTMTTHILPLNGHKVMIIQPARTHGKFYLRDSTEEQSLFEARALINTLESWVLIDEERVNIRHMDSKTFFTKGSYDDLTERLKKRDDITAVFINWSYLSAYQKLNMEKDWDKYIYDRFLMVLQIFKLHAKTAESKLQVQLAQIPYFRSLLHGYHTNKHSDVIRSDMDKSLSGISLGASSLEEKYFVLKVKEHEIREKLKDIEQNRDLHRETRVKSQLPLISVVGYTNAGKTSLIKHLTKDLKIEPKDCYFATLDVTYHSFHMKMNNSDCVMKAILLDTIGFLSEIPTDLVAAFRSTLREAMDTDLIIHVVDLSSIGWQQQMSVTLNTLNTFNLPRSLLDSIITVGTKIDRIDRSDWDQIKEYVPDMIPISNLSGENIDLLEKKIMALLNIKKGYVTKQIKIDQSTSVYRWIQSNAVIVDRTVASDGQKLLLQVLFTQSSWAKFQAHFHKK